MRAEIADVLNGLPKFLALMAKGESILLCDRNEPVAELRPVRGPAREPRPIGLAKGTFTVPPAFFEALPDDLLDAFDSGV